MKNIIIYVFSIIILASQPVFANGRSGNNMQHIPDKTVVKTSNQQTPAPIPTEVVKPVDKPKTK